MLKSTVTLNKPIYVRQAILDISKAMMFNFWYGYIKLRYKEKASLLYTDTDSLIMWIETEDIYKDQAERPDIFDLTQVEMLKIGKKNGVKSSGYSWLFLAILGCFWLFTN